jgi:hypothetical protein
VVAERKHQATALLDDVVRIDREIRALKQRMRVAVDAVPSLVLLGQSSDGG